MQSLTSYWVKVHKIGHSFPNLYKIQNTDYHGATFLMGKMEIKNITVFDHNLGFA